MLIPIIIGLAIIVLVLSYLLFQMRQRLKSIEQKHEARVQEISEASGKHEQMARTAEKKNLNLENRIYESYQYAQLVQAATMPKDDILKKYAAEYFIFYEPKDLVSGDFYWITEQDDMLFIAATDCTGHGIAGAFMAMIGNILLNEIVNENKTLDLPEILEELNNKTIATLSQQSKPEHVVGMNVSICKINKKKKTLSVAGANQISLFTNKDHVIQVKGSPFVIGDTILQQRKEVSFVSQDIRYDSGFCLYLFTDGLTVQFGGPDSKKFGIKKFMDFIYNNKTLSLSEQKEQLIGDYKEWKSQEKQIDDVLVIGLKF